jgi:hypothetical protein
MDYNRALKEFQQCRHDRIWGPRAIEEMIGIYLNVDEVEASLPNISNASTDHLTSILKLLSVRLDELLNYGTGTGRWQCQISLVLQS